MPFSGANSTMLKQSSTINRTLLYFAVQILLNVGGLFYCHTITESQIRVLGKLTRDILEHSVNVETALFRIQALPAEQTLELVQGASLMYSDPEAVIKSVQKVLASRNELNDSLESVETAIHDPNVLESVRETKDAVGRFNDAIDKSTALLLKGQKAEGMDVLMNRCTQLETSLVTSVAKLQSACTGAQSNKLDETRFLDSQRIASERKTLLWLLAGDLVVGLGFILSISQASHKNDAIR